MASFPDQARALLGVAVPAARLQPPGVDVVADLHRPAAGPGGGLELDQQRREPSVEADHQAVVAGVVDHGEDRAELVRVDRQGLLDEHRLAGRQGLAHHSRVHVMAGGDQHGVDRSSASRPRWSVVQRSKPNLRWALAADSPFAVATSTSRTSERSRRWGRSMLVA